jgi:hypothetical protein
MDLRRLTVREFRAEMNKLEEPVQVGHGYWFPSLGLLEEWVRLTGSGQTDPKTPIGSGETDHKAPSPVEATLAERDSEGGSEGPSVSRASERSQPRAQDPTVATRQMRQRNIDHILRQLNRGTRSPTKRAT